MTRQQFLSKTMKAAWTIYRKGSTTFSQALKKAWKWAKKNLNDQPSVVLSIARETAKAVLLDYECYSAAHGDYIERQMWLPKKGAIASTTLTSATLTAWGLSLLRKKFIEDYGVGRGLELHF